MSEQGEGGVQQGVRVKVKDKARRFYDHTIFGHAINKEPNFRDENWKNATVACKETVVIPEDQRERGKDFSMARYEVVLSDGKRYIVYKYYDASSPIPSVYEPISNPWKTTGMTMEDRDQYDSYVDVIKKAHKIAIALYVARKGPIDLDKKWQERGGKNMAGESPFDPSLHRFEFRPYWGFKRAEERFIAAKADGNKNYTSLDTLNPRG